MINIIAVGKIKEDFYSRAVEEYLKRLSAYTKIKVTEVADEKCGEGLSEKEAALVKHKEGERILKNIKETDHVITLEIKGRKLSSEEFAGYIDALYVKGYSDIVFVIGGSLGLDEKVSLRADLKLSFSEMTYPHMLMRVILAEQIYRAYKINKNEPYHK